MPGEFQPFQWVHHVMGGGYDPRKLLEESFMIPPKAGIYTCCDDALFRREILLTIQRSTTRFSNFPSQTLNKYQRLFSNTSSPSFQSFKAAHPYQLTQLINLDNAYEDQHKKLWEKTCIIFSSHPPNVAVQEEILKRRKKSVWSNIRYHWSTADEKSFLSKSRAISLELGIGFSFILVGGIVLIATLETFLFPLSIAMLALGGVLGLVGVITAWVDKCQAESAYEQFPQQKEAEIREIQQIKRTLLNIALSMQEVVFTLEAPGLHPSPIGSLKKVAPETADIPPAPIDSQYDLNYGAHGSQKT